MSVNRSYAQGVQGIIKACILLSLLLTLICASVWCVSYRIFFLIVSIVGFLIEFAYYLAYLLNLTDKLKIDWLKFDLFTSVALLSLSAINFIVACVYAGPLTAQDGASAFFWLVLIILLSVDIYFAFRSWHTGAPGATAQTGPSFVTEQPAAGTQPQAFTSYENETKPGVFTPGN